MIHMLLDGGGGTGLAGGVATFGGLVKRTDGVRTASDRKERLLQP